MSKLLKLKKYFSLTDAANYLSNVLEEPVSLVELYEQALEGNLAISIRLIDQVYVLETTLDLESDLENITRQVDTYLPGDFEQRVHVLTGVYDLAMIGEEKYEIRKLYQQETGGITPMFSEIKGFFINHEGRVCKFLKSLPVSKSERAQEAREARLESLLKSMGSSTQNLTDDPDAVFNNLDIKEIDQIMALVSPLEWGCGESYIQLEDPKYQFVITTKELNRFVTSLDEPTPTNGPTENTLFPLEKRSYLNFIHILLNAQRMNPSQRGLTTSLSHMSDRAGIPISDNTIRKILKEVVDNSD